MSTYYYFNSNNIKVFPCSYRGYNGEGVPQSFNAESKLHTEFNLTRGINSSWPEYNSYLISKEIKNTTFKLVIAGYYFEIENLADAVDPFSFTGDNKSLYFGIRLSDLNINANNNTDKTKVLTRFGTITEAGQNVEDNGSPDYLDEKVGTDEEGNAIYEFRGLVLTDESISNDADGIKFTLCLTDSNGNICQESFLPEIRHGAGKNSLTIGTSLTAKNDNELVIGRYNEDIDNGVFVIGNGPIAAAPSNIFTVTDTEISGKSTNIYGNVSSEIKLTINNSESQKIHLGSNASSLRNKDHYITSTEGNTSITSKQNTTIDSLDNIIKCTNSNNIMLSKDYCYFKQAKNSDNTYSTKIKSGNIELDGVTDINYDTSLHKALNVSGITTLKNTFNITNSEDENVFTVNSNTGNTTINGTLEAGDTTLLSLSTPNITSTDLNVAVTKSSSVPTGTGKLALSGDSVEIKAGTDSKVSFNIENNSGIFKFNNSSSGNGFSISLDNNNTATVSANKFFGDLDGNANTASTLKDAKTFSISNQAGDNSPAFDGSNNCNICIPKIISNFSSISSTRFIATSDRRLKENIKDSEISALDLIKQIKVKEYNFISDENKENTIGCIAQELREILPGNLKSIVSGDEEKEMLAIDNDKLIYILIKAVQELANK